MKKVKKAALGSAMTLDGLQGLARELGFCIIASNHKDGLSFQLKGHPQELTQFIDGIKRQVERSESVETPTSRSSSACSSGNFEVHDV